MLTEDNKYMNWHFKKSWREAQKSVCYTGMKQTTEAKGKEKKSFHSWEDVEGLLSFLVG